MLRKLGVLTVVMSAIWLFGCGTSTPDGSKRQTMTGVSPDSGYPGGQPNDAQSPALSSSTEQKYARSEAPESGEVATPSATPEKK